MSELTVGQMVDVEYQREGWQGTYRSKVEDIKQGTVILGIPFIDGGGLLPVRVGESVTLIYWDKVACYAAPTNVTNVSLQPLPVFSLASPATTKRFQRRAFVRVDALLSVALQEVMPNGDLDKPQAARTIDVSGGGLKLQADKVIEPGKQLALTIDFGNFTVKCRGEVIRNLVGQDGKPQVCLQFVELEDKQRDRLVSWVFKHQLELRKRGLI